ncbi:ABC transporter permease [uncultured Jatrophihabitans sp.]|uniref:ABC transporter permease n=1 Tax=uncultured Jatrophihabitans sp. TaxID=1610747 RepID=UPI0035CB111A
MTLSPGELEVAVEAMAGEDLGRDGGEIEGRSLGQLAWRRLKHDKLALAGGVVALLLILIGLFAPLLTRAYGQTTSAPHYNLVDSSTQLPLGSNGGMSGTHWLGVTPVLGQDILAQLMFGARTSLVIAISATFLSLFFGVILGVVSGFYRGVADSIISRIMDLLLAFPVTLFSIALLAVFAIVPSFLGLSGVHLRFAVLIFVLGFFGFPYIGRIVRGQVLSLREKEFVDAARSLGASNYRIMTREIFPNLVGPILVYTTLTIPNYILGEAGLSYIGVGVQSPTVSWGGMLSDAGSFFQVDATFLLAPGLALFLAVLSFNLFGDGLRDAFDPRSSR